MADLPRFVARALTDAEREDYRHGGRLPTCHACGEPTFDVDESTGLDRACWRSGPWALAWTLRGRVLSYEPQT